MNSVRRADRVCRVRHDSMKKPRRSGAVPCGGSPQSREGKPADHYHSWLSSGDFAEKAPPEGAGPSWSRRLDGACRREANHQRQAALLNAAARIIGCTAREGRVPNKSPARGTGLSGCALHTGSPSCDARQTHRTQSQRSVAQRRGDFAAVDKITPHVAARATLPPKQTQIPHWAPIPLAKGSCLAQHTKKPRQG